MAPALRIADQLSRKSAPPPAPGSSGPRIPRRPPTPPAAAPPATPAPGPCAGRWYKSRGYCPLLAGPPLCLRHKIGADRRPESIGPEHLPVTPACPAAAPHGKGQRPAADDGIGASRRSGRQQQHRGAVCRRGQSRQGGQQFTGALASPTAVRSPGKHPAAQQRHRRQTQQQHDARSLRDRRSTPAPFTHRPPLPAAPWAAREIRADASTGLRQLRYAARQSAAASSKGSSGPMVSSSACSPAPARSPVPGEMGQWDGDSPPFQAPAGRLKGRAVPRRLPEPGADAAWGREASFLRLGAPQ